MSCCCRWYISVHCCQHGGGSRGCRGPNVKKCSRVQKFRDHGHPQNHQLAVSGPRLRPFPRMTKRAQIEPSVAAGSSREVVTQSSCVSRTFHHAGRPRLSLQGRYPTGSTSDKRAPSGKELLRSFAPWKFHGGEAEERARATEFEKTQSGVTSRSFGVAVFSEYRASR